MVPKDIDDEFKYSPSFDPLKSHFSSEQLECRHFGKKLVNLVDNEKLKGHFFSDGSHSPKKDRSKKCWVNF